MSDPVKAAKVSAKSIRLVLAGRWSGCRVLMFESNRQGEGTA